MRTPICRPCAIGNSLCPACQAKLSSGEISELDIEVSRIIYKVNEFYNLSLASFTHAIDVGEQVIIFTDGEPGVLIGRGGRVISAISSALGKRARVVSQSPDARRMLEDLIFPAKIIGINESYSASGESWLLIRVKKEGLKLARMDISKLEPIVSRWMNKPIKFAFE
jgi:transcription antitermination factor NusA-like protein